MLHNLHHMITLSSFRTEIIVIISALLDLYSYSRNRPTYTILLSSVPSLVLVGVFTVAI